MLAGLRRGELLGLRWADIDLKAGVPAVERSWNPDSREYTAPKSGQGKRKVPIGSQLSPHLKAHALATGRRDGLVFGQTAERPTRPESIQSRADKAWEDAGLERVTLHACRHLYASMSIAAGVNAHSLCKYMGHSGIQVTYDLSTGTSSRATKPKHPRCWTTTWFARSGTRNRDERASAGPHE